MLESLPKDGAAPRNFDKSKAQLLRDKWQTLAQTGAGRALH